MEKVELEERQCWGDGCPIKFKCLPTSTVHFCRECLIKSAPKGAGWRRPKVAPPPPSPRRP